MTPRPAATLILLREGMEVLMLQRTQNAAFLGGAYVFPGGSLDPQDSDMRRVVGLTEAQANERLQLAVRRHRLLRRRDPRMLRGGRHPSRPRPEWPPIRRCSVRSS